jgi:hypothetical protein
MSGAALAILGDYVPMGLGQALGRHAGGDSFDNTLLATASQSTILRFHDEFEARRRRQQQRS